MSFPEAKTNYSHPCASQKYVSAKRIRDPLLPPPTPQTALIPFLKLNFLTQSILG